MVLGSSVQFQISVHNYGEGHFLWALYENSRHLCRNSGFADVNRICFFLHVIVLLHG